ncbi:MAG: hypothetical protein MJ201_04365 [Mycoplasmoidaceae bacterium]|nr:hypothetical protein [Mycoplasmoidaceae bacterium]
MIGTSNYLSLSTTFEPQKVGEAYVSEAYSFQLVFTFTKEGEEPRVTTYPDVGFG